MFFAVVTRQVSVTFYSSVTSGFRRDVDKICALLGYYKASCGNCLPTFRTTYRSHLQGSRSPRSSSWISWPLKTVPTRFPERRYRITSRRCVISQKSADPIFRYYTVMSEMVIWVKTFRQDNILFWTLQSSVLNSSSFWLVLLTPNTFFFRWRAPQQMLRTHCSLKASCATPVMKMSSIFFTKFYN